MIDLCKVYGVSTPRKKPKYSRFRKVFKVVHDANGNKHFDEIGATDVFALAQSHKEACSIENIIKRATNDPSVLQRTVGQYMDLTKVPTNMAECFEVIENAKKTFKDMPQTLRDTYNNNFATFLGDFKTATGLAKYLAAVNVKTENNVESEVKIDA